MIRYASVNTQKLARRSSILVIEFNVQMTARVTIYSNYIQMI